MSELHIVGVDLAKRVFHVQGVDLDKKLTRPQFEAFLAELPSCIVAIEACVWGHHWGRVASRFGS